MYLYKCNYSKSFIVAEGVYLDDERVETKSETILTRGAVLKIRQKLVKIFMKMKELGKHLAKVNVQCDPKLVTPFPTETIDWNMSKTGDCLS